MRLDLTGEWLATNPAQKNLGLSRNVIKHNIL
jgi:hypothetical protein